LVRPSFNFLNSMCSSPKSLRPLFRASSAARTATALTRMYVFCSFGFWSIDLHVFATHTRRTRPALAHLAERGVNKFNVAINQCHIRSGGAVLAG